MSIPEGTVLKIAQNILLNDGQTAVNVFWAVVSNNAGPGSLPEEDVLEAARVWMNQLYNNIDDDIADTVVSTIVEVWEVVVPTGVLIPVGDIGTGWVGLNAADSLPNGVAAIASIKTTKSDVTGRKFLPGYAENTAVDNDLIGAALARLVLFAADWATTFVSAEDVILSPGVYSGTDFAFWLATGVAIANVILGYQRRRKPGVGS